MGWCSPPICDPHDGMPMSQEEADHFGWYSRSVVIELDNGVLLWPSRDDEGNDAGAIFTTDPKGSTLPVLWGGV